jgi:hypothetical protein
MLLLKLLVVAAMVGFLLRLSGRWSGPIRLPHRTPALLSRGRTAGRGSVASDSESETVTDSERGWDDQDEDLQEDDEDWDDESPTDPMASDAVHVSPGQPRITVKVRGNDDEPRLGGRFSSRLERMSGYPRVVPETPPPPPPTPGSREERARALREHLLEMRDRPGMRPTRIVRSAANEPGAPWGNVSTSTVWRAWQALPPRS